MIVLTVHAIDQFRNRFHPLVSHEEARALLDSEIQHAKRFRDSVRLPDKSPVWLLPCGGWAVIGTGRKGDKGDRIVVTVLPVNAYGVGDSEEDEEEIGQ
jgi:hypothetical protein